MIADQREFRAIALCSRLRAHQVADLFPERNMSRALEPMPVSVPGFDVFRGNYYSEVQYTTWEGIVDHQVFHAGRECYRYPIYLCQWERSRRCVVFAVPFSKLATEVFRVVNEQTRAKSRRYLKLELTTLVEQLREGRFGENIEAPSILFRVAGGDNVRSTEMSGRDVISSQFYRRTLQSLHGIELVPRRIRLRFESHHRRFGLTADANGNFSFRVAKDGRNLGFMADLLNELDHAEVLQETPAYPLRRGVQQEAVDE